MLPAMAKPSIAIVGPGRWGSALAAALAEAGYSITEIISRNKRESFRRARVLAKVVGGNSRALDDARLDANLIWFCVPDREIANAAKKLASRAAWKGKIAFHSSGALASDELDALRTRGAVVASVHPLMTFVKGGPSSLAGVPFALEGDAAALQMARRILRDLRATPFMIHKKHKVVYHAWGAFASPLLISLLVTAEQVGRAAGLSSSDARKKVLPILRRTMENYARFGAAGALSGPLVRGDAKIVMRHLEFLKKIPEAREVYRALARSVVRYLPVPEQKKLREILK
jgi:predicted short-subunit dehydrogenase-like oxidoreductase (DUF2520 family)